MSNISRKLTFYVGILTFTLISLLGVIAEVSLKVIFIRSITSTLIVCFLTYVACFFIYNLVIKEHIQDIDSTANFDYVADEEIPISKLNEETEKSLFNDPQIESLSSFTPTHIDSTIENIINQDPQKAADILRKMGLDE